MHAGTDSCDMNGRNRSSRSLPGELHHFRHKEEVRREVVYRCTQAQALALCLER